MTSTACRHALPLAREEALAYHDTQRAGFFSLLVQGADGKRRQKSHKLEYLPEVIKRIDPARDTWISQGEFFRPNRQVVNLWRMPLAYIDLDTYNVTELAGRSAEFQLARLLEHCNVAGLPQPSLVVFSGRGLQAKWLFEKPVPRKALPRWQALQKELCRRLSPLGADPKALDASRVLRLVETVNTKSDNLARLVYQDTTPTMGGVRMAGGLVGYDFDVLMDTVMPLTRTALESLNEERQPQRELWAFEKAAREARKAQLLVVAGGKTCGTKVNSNRRVLVPSELAWARLADIRKLAVLRGWAEGAPAKERDLPLFLSACFLAQAMVVPHLRAEIAELATEFAPTWTAAQIESCTSSVLARAEAAARGEVVQFNGFPVDPRYRWRNGTLIDRLGITPGEERQMSTIIGGDEARRRDTERKRITREQARANGLAISRTDWREGHEQKRASVRILRAQGHSWQAIATQLGYASADAARMAGK